MELFLKNTQTLIGSKISTMIFNIIRRKDESQDRVQNSECRVASIIFTVFSFLILNSAFFTPSAHAVVDPLSVTNNKFGIHILSPVDNEASPAADLVNSSGGDWGYVTILIEDKDIGRKDKWQQFFNDLRSRHLIPIVRLATHPLDDHWQTPMADDANKWADFLNSLNWPVKNRYVVVYNEPNQGKEWNNRADPAGYAKVLDATIKALKAKSDDFFVLNAGFDASSPEKPPAYIDEATFLKSMNEAVPGIFNELDGWASHSYPNPGFKGSPDGYGKGSIRTFEWELSYLKQLGLTKDLPVFITETGWSHAEGKVFDPSLPPAKITGQNLLKAFQDAWNNPRIVAVTPFVLDYQDSPFDHFSFRKINGEKSSNLDILGASYPDFYPGYADIISMVKAKGTPTQVNSAKLISGGIYYSLVTGETYNLPITVENTGQSIWNDGNQVRLEATQGGRSLGLSTLYIPKDTRVEPGGQYTFTLHVVAPAGGSYDVNLNLFAGNNQFDSQPFSFKTEVKSPVILSIKTGLIWKKDFSGDYLLKAASKVGENIMKIALDANGQAFGYEARNLLPGYEYDFTLSRPFYKAATIHQTVYSGSNTLNFGLLQPDVLGALLHPKAFWQLLPFSN